MNGKDIVIFVVCVLAAAVRVCGVCVLRDGPK